MSTREQAILLRPRSKPTASGTSHLSKSPASHESLLKSKYISVKQAMGLMGVRLGYRQITRTRRSKVMLILGILLVWSAYMRFSSNQGLWAATKVSPLAIESRLSSKVPKGIPRYKENVENIVPGKRMQRLPLVDRAILDKLDRMEEFFAPDYVLKSPEQILDSPTQWPPVVTRIPERSDRIDRKEGICESTTHPRPCRFLLPLRISEQESKARIHFLQLVQLARALNRTLVLPNVGKSKIGACFRWPFNTYYDGDTLGVNPNDTERFVDQGVFRNWVENRGRRGSLRYQLVSVSPGLPSRIDFKDEPAYSNQGVRVHAYRKYRAWESEIPGCFLTKFPRLELGNQPLFVSLTPAASALVSGGRLGEFIAEAFSMITYRTQRDLDLSKFIMNRPEIYKDRPALSEPDILVVNWDLRHPIFEASLSDQTLQYSPRIKHLADRFLPRTPYLVVHWRMETVDADVLSECAHALVDLLGTILREHSVVENITTVWFASDYPYPVARRTSTQAQPVIAAKSGTFKDFDVRHEEAVDILRNAFDEQGELNGWKLTDLVQNIDEGKGDEAEELFQDAGVMGILDKLVSIKAALFVSGSKQCSRKSSFTKQVVDARQSKWSRMGTSNMRNIVDSFG